MVCSDCYPGMVGAFAPLKEICPDRATPELMEPTARLGSVVSYRQAANVLTKFLPVETTETHATVPKRTSGSASESTTRLQMKNGSRQGKWRSGINSKCPLPGDRRKEFVISIDTAHVRSAEPNSARSFELVVARCGRGGRGDAGGRYFVTASTEPKVGNILSTQVQSQGTRTWTNMA